MTNDSNIVPEPSHAGEHEGPAHAPGPWTVRFARRDDWATVDCADQGDAVVSIGPYRADYRANARLIAASPDLLEATLASRDDLERAADLLEHAGHKAVASICRKQADYNRAAIAKAEGRT